MKSVFELVHLVALLVWLGALSYAGFAVISTGPSVAGTGYQETEIIRSPLIFAAIGFVIYLISGRLKKRT